MGAGPTEAGPVVAWKIILDLREAPGRWHRGCGSLLRLGLAGVGEAAGPVALGHATQGECWRSAVLDRPPWRRGGLLPATHASQDRADESPVRPGGWRSWTPKQPEERVRSAIRSLMELPPPWRHRQHTGMAGGQRVDGFCLIIKMLTPGSIQPPVGRGPWVNRHDPGAARSSRPGTRRRRSSAKSTLLDANRLAVAVDSPGA